MSRERRDKLLALRATLQGEVRTDETHRAIFATDASIYSETPEAVAFPKNERDLLTLVTHANETDSCLIPRAAGTSLAGQVVGSGLVVDIGRHMNTILELDENNRSVRVEPGVIQDDLNRFLGPSGLLFGPDTSTSSRAMIGGMMGNNSCGSRSIRYGTTREHVLGCRAILADGSTYDFKDWDSEQLAEQTASDVRLARLLNGLRDIVDRYRPQIDSRFPKEEVIRRNTGYALDYLAKTVLLEPEGEPLNLAKFLCGSEGTLAVWTEATLNCEPKPEASGVVVAHFETLRAALEATVEVVKLNPSAVELIDKPILDRTLDQLQQRRNRFFIEGDPEAVLIIEFFGDSEEDVTKKKAEVSAALTDGGKSYYCADIAADRVHQVWALRKAGLGLLMGIRGDFKPVAFVEDTAVAVEDLPEYIDEYSAIMARYGVECVYYGHASVGELHLRPSLNLKDSAEVDKLKGIGKEVAELVGKYNGSLSGEHGDGRVRSPFIADFMGEELAEAFREVKALWDPDNRLNPGKIVDPKPVEADLRTHVDTATPEVPTTFSFDREMGIVRATEKCNGAGACRKLDGAGGVMCPSYRATRDELHSTRGRANLMRTLLTSGDPEKTFESEELYQALSLCLACKGCKTECSASVDLAKLKSEFLQQYRDKKGTPLAVRAFAWIAAINRLGSIVPWLTNFVMRNRVLSGVLRRILGVHKNRHLPPLSRTSFRRWLSGRSLKTNTQHGSIVLFVDEFTDYQDAVVGRDSVELLEALGYDVATPKHADSGRPLISKGMLRAARKRAIKNVHTLFPFAEAGHKIVGLEPSAALTLVDEYPDLVPPAMLSKAKLVAEQTQLLEDFLAEEHDKRDLSDYFVTEERAVLLHGHCHQKALVGTGGALSALSIPAGYRAELIDAGCCGMAGSFGYETEHYDLSMQIGESRLFPAVRSADAETIIAAAGFSCRHQIYDGTQRKALHPAQVLRRALRDDLVSEAS